MIGWPLVGIDRADLPVAAEHLGDAERVHGTHREHGRATGEFHPVRGRPPGEWIGDGDAPGRRVGVDQVGRGQGGQGRRRVQPELGRQAGSYGGIRWAGPGQERAQQALVEHPQRVGQDRLAAADAGTRFKPSQAVRPRIGGRGCSGMVAGHAIAPKLPRVVSGSRSP